MIYLLDVNALLALGFTRHIHHQRVRLWLEFVRCVETEPVSLASCSITEIGFLRIASGGAALAKSLIEAKNVLLRLKRTETFQFVSDGIAGEDLPAWVSRSAQVTDGHLLQVARVCGARLATLDAGIPGAELITDALQARDSVQPEPYGSYAARARSTSAEAR